MGVLLLLAVMYSPTKAAQVVLKPVCSNSLWILGQQNKHYRNIDGTPEECTGGSADDCNSIMVEYGGNRAWCADAARHTGWKCNSAVHGDSCIWNGYQNLDDNMNEIV